MPLPKKTASVKVTGGEGQIAAASLSLNQVYTLDLFLPFPFGHAIIRLVPLPLLFRLPLFPPTARKI